MKDSNKKSDKSSSDSISPVKNTISEMPKDKRTKAYKEWIKKYGEQNSDSTNIPEMPKDKRTKAYKDWVKQYGNEKSDIKKSDKKTDEIKFKSLSGPLYVKKNDRLLRMNFPCQKPKKCEMPQGLLEALDQKPKFCYSSEDYIAIYSTEYEISQIKPDFKKLKRLDLRGLIVTAPGKDYDFVSRGFFPKYGIPEDPVTGSAHTVLTPYWSTKFNGQKNFVARQCSKRGGDLSLTLNDNDNK